MEKKISWIGIILNIVSAIFFSMKKKLRWRSRSNTEMQETRLTWGAPTNAEIWRSTVMIEDFDDLNWNKKGCKSTVRDQGRDPTCAFFATATTLSYVRLIEEKQHIELSPQYLYEESQFRPAPIERVAQFVKRHGVVQEHDCPYTGSMIPGDTRSKACMKLKVNNVKELFTEAEIIMAVEFAPVIGAMKSWAQFLPPKDKTLTEQQVNSLLIREYHAVCIIGYGTRLYLEGQSIKKTVRYYVVQNSAGQRFLDGGTGLVPRDDMMYAVQVWGTKVV